MNPQPVAVPQERIFDTKEAIRAFSVYNDRLINLYWDIASSGKFREATRRVSADLVAAELRRLIPIENLRDAGSFFTGDELAEKALSLFPKPVTEYSVVFDPACGAGNLLTACSRCLPVFRMVSDTLRLWGRVLHGFDLYPEFVEATKLHLILEAISRNADPNGDSLDDLKALLSGIRCGDGLAGDMPVGCTHVFMNPPFRAVQAHAACEWGGGSINEAGLFVEHCITEMSAGTSMVAILPEVLRCGSRYGKWRQMLGRNASVKISPSGQFDTKTQIDVFVASCVKTTGKSNSGFSIDWQTSQRDTLTVGDLFEVHVGPVVPHRHKLDGQSNPFVRVADLPWWDTVNANTLPDRCGFEGNKFTPPFVAIRRTSSPADSHRAIATLVVGTQPVAVENHLLVAVPRTGDERACRKLLKILRDPQTTEDLNRRIRCRHLTVGAVLDIACAENCDA